MIIALTQEDLNFWWIALGMGVVLIIAVIVLLTLLSSFVKDIDERVDDAWNTATRLAANTATTWMLDQAAVQTNDLRVEVGRHAQLLGVDGRR
ncbi:MAG TPA: hypothetical protein VG184_02590 [Acidimicrobiales bacterium]|jgi:Na+/H+ antiporter NhaD/arsenite permease-like protein|nr:hypothetical protein [Acidimicrobiales bacterium]